MRYTLPGLGGICPFGLCAFRNAISRCAAAALNCWYPSNRPSTVSPWLVVPGMNGEESAIEIAEIIPIDAGADLTGPGHDLGSGPVVATARKWRFVSWRRCPLETGAQPLVSAGAKAVGVEIPNQLDQPSVEGLRSGDATGGCDFEHEIESRILRRSRHRVQRCRRDLEQHRCNRCRSAEGVQTY